MDFAYADTPQKIGVHVSALDSILQASLVVQLTLLTLITLSIVCWAIVFYKRQQLKRSSEANQKFLSVFWDAPSLDSIFERIQDHRYSPIAKVYKAGFLELQRLAESNLAKRDSNIAPQLAGIDNLSRALRKAVDNELNQLESRLSLLATTSSQAPFIGLFGTVWGIMNAFSKIAATGSASLAVVAPGISEALITTAVGLVTAIPAGAAYNYFLTNIKKQDLDLSNFSSDFLNIAKRNFFKKE